MNKDLKKLRDKLYKRYHFNNQHLYVSTECYMSGDDTCLEIQVTNKTGQETFEYLFEIVNLKFACKTEFKGVRKYFNKPDLDKRFFRKSNILELAYKPLYTNKPYRLFTLKKFETITNEDILSCVDYFMHKVLDACWCFKIQVITGDIDESKKQQIGY